MDDRVRVGVALLAQSYDRHRCEKKHRRVTLVRRQLDRSSRVMYGKRLACGVSAWPSLVRWDGRPRMFDDDAAVLSNEALDST